jgi:hypothetical protein
MVSRTDSQRTKQGAEGPKQEGTATSGPTGAAAGRISKSKTNVSAVGPQEALALLEKARERSLLAAAQGGSPFQRSIYSSPTTSLTLSVKCVHTEQVASAAQQQHFSMSANPLVFAPPVTYCLDRLVKESVSELPPSAASSSYSEPGSKELLSSTNAVRVAGVAFKGCLHVRV